jgi:hypothetical protein
MKEAGVDREPAFPIYAQVAYDLAACPVPKEYEPGRCVITGHLNPDQTITDDFIERHVGPNDIVTIPLYQGTYAHGSIGVQDKLGAYQDNLRAMSRLAGRCKGVNIGNAYAELTFKHLYPLDEASAAAAEFVIETSRLAKEHGGHKVWYGLIDFDAAIDCYYGHAILRDTVISLGDALITYCGYTMFGGHIPYAEANPPEGYHVRPIQTQKQWLPTSEDAPWPELSAYIAGAEEWVTGVGSTEGLLAGNDQLLAEHGFAYGDMGVF